MWKEGGLHHKWREQEGLPHYVPPPHMSRAPPSNSNVYFGQIPIFFGTVI